MLPGSQPQLQHRLMVFIAFTLLLALKSASQGQQRTVTLLLPNWEWEWEWKWEWELRVTGKVNDATAEATPAATTQIA